MKLKMCFALTLVAITLAFNLRAESQKEYENRLKIMLDLSVRIDEYVRRRLTDKGLVGYAQALAEKNADLAERMTPPKQYQEMHPHFLLALENIERSFFYAASGKFDKYRHHQKIVRSELMILETLAQRAGLSLYVFEGD